MTFSVSRFKSAGLAFGGARPSLFEAEITFPTQINTSQVIEGGRFLIKAAQLPASSVDSIDVPYFGRKVKVVGDRTFNDWTVTIMNDENFGLRDAMESWSNLMNQLEGNRQIISSFIGGDTGVGYKAELIVRQFAKEQSDTGEPLPSRVYKFVGAFPTSVDAISLDWDRTNTIEEFDVTFAYDYWVPVDEGTTVAQYAGAIGTN